MPLINGGLGRVSNGTAPLDSDSDGMPDSWETSHGLNKNLKADATTFSTMNPGYLNIEVYLNSLVSSTLFFVQRGEKTPAPLRPMTVK
jgi:hypothetical protein